MYVTQQQIEAAIPPQFLREALDDDNDGQADNGVLDLVISTASTAADALLCGRYETPFAEPPANVARAAFVFACELVYQRRQVPADQNPWTKEADGWRTKLTAIGEGESDLTSTGGLAAAAGGQPYVPGRVPAPGAATTYGD